MDFEERLIGRFEQTFTRDPRLWTRLEHALTIVERDVRTVGFTGKLRLITHGWDGDRSAWVEYKGDYHGEGIPAFEGNDPQQALWAVADSVQEVIMELVWFVWPVCATHDLGTHAGWEDGLPVWWCADDGGHTVAPIGELR